MRERKINKFIERKSLLYKTMVERSDYTINHVLGCAHNCKYPCYAYQMKRRFGQIKNEQEWQEPALVKNALELLEKELPRLKNKIKSVHLSYTTDPFMYGFPEVKNLSLELIERINRVGIPCTVLTKGILPEELADLSKDNEYAITLISSDESFREKMEPGAADLESRVLALKNLSKKGFRTWVSIEPFPTPNIYKNNLGDILNRISFTDHIYFGRLNYNRKVSEYKDWKNFYRECSNEVKSFCKINNIVCTINKGTPV